MSLESAAPAKSKWENAFKHPDSFTVGDETIEAVDLEPEHPKTEIPLIIEPGWSGHADATRRGAELFAEAGRHVLSVSAPHGITPAYEDADVPMAELRKAEALMQIMDKKNIEKADVFGHSEAALFVTAAALKNPERIRTIVLFAPVGLIGEDGFWKLVARYGHDLAKQTAEMAKGKGGKERAEYANTGLPPSLKAIFGSPLKSLAEVQAIASMQIEENLRELRKKGVKIILASPVGDKAFPIERIVRTVKADMVDGFISTGNPSQTGEIADTHNAWFLSPEKYVPAIDSLLDTMERNIAKEKVA